MEEIKGAVKAAVKDLFNVDVEPQLTRSDEQFGDYATNIALQLAGKLDNPPAGGPRGIAEALAKEIKSTKIEKVETAGPGFLNITLSDKALVSALNDKVSQPYKGKVVVTEYSDPNPFKVLHAGHLYTSVVGDAISNLLEAAGADVHRVNFGGDVGMHVGKTMWAILKELGGENPDKLQEIDKEERSEWLAKCYVEGTNAYEDDEQAKKEIISLNKRVYQIVTDNDRTSPFGQIYWKTRQWSYDYFDSFYARIGSKFERYYPESEVSELGLKTVEEQLKKGVFEKSDGAIIFDGDKYDLHTRVFINSDGIPTYEAKDVGLILTKKKDYNFDLSVVITGNEQEQYMNVVLKAVEQFAPELAKATRHLPHGIVKLQGGVKMSSRKGNILRAVDVLEAANEANKAENDQENEETVLAAVKYSFLKQRIGADIIYDPKESVSILGNSGPYLQYAYARARSILRKSKVESLPTGKAGQKLKVVEFEAGERSLIRKIGEYPEAVGKAVSDLMPHHICTYLYDLAQVFNRFYEQNRVIDNPREAVRLQLVQSYADTLKNGLELLNIPAPEKM